MVEVSGSVLRGEDCKGVGKGILKRGQRACLQHTQTLFELSPAFFDRIEVGRVGWQIEKGGPGLQNAFGDTVDFVRSQVVHNHDLTGQQAWAQHVIEVSQENVSIGGGFNRHEGDPAGNADSAEYCQCSPAPGRNSFMESVTAHDAAIAPRHFGGDSTLVEEDEPCRIDLFGFFLPELSFCSDPPGLPLRGME